MKNQGHTFHIPVMGTSFTIDTPLKVSKYGISSAISIVDDDLIEKMRRHYCEVNNLDYKPVTDKEHDHRAKRIKLYLNLIQKLVQDTCIRLQYDEFESGGEINKYFELLPDSSELKQMYDLMISTKNNVDRYVIQEWLRKQMEEGAIDVNIMTKLDKANYDNNAEELPVNFNDAHAALRGFAQSDLASSMILSAGMNPRLYSYMAEFDDFFPDKNGKIKKKITLKVSDYRSALIQGKFLAKKGLWVSEYRIESGLNCGGHAFATEGNLLGPILEEFKRNRSDLINATFELCQKAWKEKELRELSHTPLMSITVQGGIGEASEHEFLLDHFKVNSTGWGSLFLLVPEVTNVDEDTLELLSKAGEEDLYLSQKSPLGIPFNAIRGNTKDVERKRMIEKNRPGSSCPKKYLSLNKEFTGNAICTASRQYQDLKIKQLDEKNLSDDEYRIELEEIAVKECLCTGLAASALNVHGLNSRSDGHAVSICPGPNLAYFSKVVSLKDMVNHIYGKARINTSPSRPNMFIKEINLYIDYFGKELEKAIRTCNSQRTKYLESFQQNLLSGIEYYKEMFTGMTVISKAKKSLIKLDLANLESQIRAFQIPALEPLAVHGQK